MTWPASMADIPPPRTPTGDAHMRLLLVEDDPGDAFLVTELLEETEAPVDVTVAQTVAEAIDLVDGADCVLLDLGLPDSHGLAGLARLRAVADVAVCVLTGLEDEHLGIAAVRAGAQDYLIKSEVSGHVLIRSIRYAVQRQRADADARRLREVELRHAESARLERGLLPQPLTTGDAVRIVPFYLAGRDGILGGDFLDVVQTGPDQFHMLVGDVAGHSVDEAALGVQLRSAWRALILAGVDESDVFATLEQVLESERHAPEIFATAAMISLQPGAGTARIRLAGHPPPILVSAGHAEPVGAGNRPVLGVGLGGPCDATDVRLPTGDWQLIVYTDGLIEGHCADGRLGTDGLCRILTGDLPANFTDLPRHLAEKAREHNGGPLTDDLAIVAATPAGGHS